MTASRKRFTQEFKDELRREVINTSKPIRTWPPRTVSRLRRFATGWSSTEANGGTEADLTSHGWLFLDRDKLWFERWATPRTSCGIALS